MDDFTLFTPQDKSTVAYRACVGGTALVGAAVGRFGGLYGVLLGAAVGAGYGLLSCKKLPPIIEQKLLSQNARLTDAELSKALAILREQAGVQSRREGLYVIAQVRRAAALNSEALIHAPKACLPMRTHVTTLLSHMPRAA